MAGGVIDVPDLIELLAKQCVLSVLVLDKLLKESKKIPAELRGKTIWFLGTVYREVFEGEKIGITWVLRFYCNPDTGFCFSEPKAWLDKTERLGNGNFNSRDYIAVLHQ